MKIKAKIDRMVNSGNVKAIASVSLDGMFVVKNLKIMDGKKGLFVSMPQETFPGKDGQKKYSNLFFALTNSAKLELQETVLQAYQQQIDPNYIPKQSYEEQDDYTTHYCPPCCRCHPESRPGQRRFRRCWRRSCARVQCSTGVRPDRQHRHTGRNASPGF